MSRHGRATSGAERAGSRGGVRWSSRACAEAGTSARRRVACPGRQCCGAGGRRSCSPSRTCGSWRSCWAHSCRTTSSSGGARRRPRGGRRWSEASWGGSRSSRCTRTSRGRRRCPSTSGPGCRRCAGATRGGGIASPCRRRG